VFTQKKGSNMDGQRVGAYLRKLRQERGISAAAVAAALGTGERVVYRIEGGEGRTMADTLLRYAALVGADANRIMQMYADECTCEGAAA
jgi:transcriptional regulator with XRE-family HTH domain